MRDRSRFLARFAALLFLVLSLGASVGASRAQTPPAPAPTSGTPAQVDALLKLLADPAVKAWLEQRQEAARPASRPQPEGDEPGSGLVSTFVAQLRSGAQQLAEGAQKLPADTARARDILLIEFQERGLFGILVLAASFVGLGFGTSWLFFLLTRSIRKRIIANPLLTVSDRLRAVTSRFFYGLSMVGAFALGSIGAFLALNWPPLLHEIVGGYLFAFLMFRVAQVVVKFLFAPGAERFRIVPMTTVAALHWSSRGVVLVGWIAFAFTTLSLLTTLGFSPQSLRLLGSLTSFVTLCLILEAVWSRPLVRPEGEAGLAAERQRRIENVLLTGFFLVLWLTRVLGMLDVTWGMLVIGGALGLVRIADRSVRHVLRKEEEGDPDGEPSLKIVLIERGIRMVLVLGAAVLLAHLWGLSADAISTGESATHRLLRGAISAGVILLIADFLWHIIATLIDKRVFLASRAGEVDEETKKERQRMRTLLPIFRNILQIVLAVMAVLMALSALGVEIGPLIAGAGVVGVAIGFGAQTLVKDVISGVFYLLDDAFRVGEYIQSGSFKGTVESFSLRSVKLRHHRGPIYTVPFGSLGAIQNMSRDWVIDKMSIGVTYDTDLEKARKLIKTIGKDLAADPEMGRHILEPLKMQGVEQFGDFAIQIRLKITTKPGEQFVIRRKAYAAIKKAFAENGIRFAFPTVQVAGGDAEDAAAARQVLAKEPVAAE